MSLLELSAVASVSALASVQLFVSAVDVPALNQEAARNAWTAKRFFGLWWPKAARVVPPLIIASVALSSGAYYRSGNSKWLNVAVVVGSTIPFTAFFLGGRIHRLLEPSQDDSKAEAANIKEQIAAFGERHHPRTLLALIGAALAVNALVDK